MRSPMALPARPSRTYRLTFTSGGVFPRWRTVLVDADRAVAEAGFVAFQIVKRHRLDGSAVWLNVYLVSYTYLVSYEPIRDESDHARGAGEL